MKLAMLPAILSGLLIGGAAFAAPPDQVRNSPIPPLQAPAPRGRQPRVVQQTPPAPEGIAALPATGSARVTAAPVQTGVAAPEGTTPGNYPEEEEVDYDAQRAEIWNSPEMREARQFVMEFTERAAQVSEQEGRAFLQQLSQLSPDDMRSWLERYQQNRMRLNMGRAVQENARQLGLENALSRQGERQQAFNNINQYQSQAAEWARINIQAQGQAGQEMRNARSFRRDMTVLAERQPRFDPFYPQFDPSSPPAAIAAAASLPGDLPRGDARNFIRGEAGIDTGANTSPQDAAAAARGGDPRSGPLPTGSVVGGGGGGGAGGGGGGTE